MRISNATNIMPKIRGEKQIGVTTQPTRFNVIVQKDDTWYVAKCVDNSVASQGKTIEEALDNLKEALELHYEEQPLYDLPV